MQDGTIDDQQVSRNFELTNRNAQAKPRPYFRHSRVFVRCQVEARNPLRVDTSLSRRIGKWLHSPGVKRCRNFDFNILMGLCAPSVTLLSTPKYAAHPNGFPSFCTCSKHRIQECLCATIPHVASLSLHSMRESFITSPRFELSYGCHQQCLTSEFMGMHRHCAARRVAERRLATQCRCVFVSYDLLDLIHRSVRE